MEALKVKFMEVRASVFPITTIVLILHLLKQTAGFCANLLPASLPGLRSFPGSRVVSADVR